MKSFFALIVMIVSFQSSAFAGNCGSYCSESCIDGRRFRCHYQPYSYYSCDDAGPCTGEPETFESIGKSSDENCNLQNPVKRKQARQNATFQAFEKCKGSVKQVSEFQDSVKKLSSPYADPPCFAAVFTSRAQFQCGQ